MVDARVNAALVDELHALLAPLDPAGQLGISLLDGPGLALRALSNSTEPLNKILAAAVDLLRGRWYRPKTIELKEILMTATARLAYLEREKLPVARRMGVTFWRVAFLHMRGGRAAGVTRCPWTPTRWCWGWW